eukprot:2852985-Alexandrium_andersonii.AAC.1
MHSSRGPRRAPQGQTAARVCSLTSSATRVRATMRSWWQKWYQRYGARITDERYRRAYAHAFQKVASVCLLYTSPSPRD